MARAERLSLLSSIGSAELYKRNQGRLVRLLTGLALATAVVLGCWTASLRIFGDFSQPIRVGVPVAIAAVGLWLSFRAIHLPAFADFLIDVEGEMVKVSWTGRSELYRATVVVVSCMASLSLVLFLYDILWQYILGAIGVLRI
jgi:preprotein translocase subunit SecE